MQIDILSSNTLKLTLSRLDMFDLDIKYESLSGKNPETKRLLAHVLKSVKLDKIDQRLGIDFTGDRIFVEAFPRPDGGCMLYVSSLNGEPPIIEKISEPKKSEKALLIIETDDLKHIGKVCKSIESEKLQTALYISEAEACNKYRLVMSAGDANKQISRVAREFGRVLRGEKELMLTKERFKPLIEENAAERLSGLF